ncbi:MAG TPA: hypothetical protein V6D25_00070 [Leptolyngbyaceae cyanobacterium]
MKLEAIDIKLATLHMKKVITKMTPLLYPVSFVVLLIATFSFALRTGTVAVKQKKYDRTRPEKGKGGKGESIKPFRFSLYPVFTYKYLRAELLTYTQEMQFVGAKE